MSHRLSWVLALVVIAAAAAVMALIGADDSTQRSPVPVPANAESARADTARAQLPGGDRVPVILVVTRTDGNPLTPADLDAAGLARQRMLEAARTGPQPPPVQVSIRMAAPNLM